MDGERLRVSLAQDVEHPAIFGHHEVTALFVVAHALFDLLILHVRLELFLPFCHRVVSSRVKPLGFFGSAWSKPRGCEAVLVNP